MWTHIASGCIILILTAVYSILAIQKFNWAVRATWHDLLGMINLVLVFLLDA